jgi:hypothetical protein
VNTGAPARPALQAGVAASEAEQGKMPGPRPPTHCPAAKLWDPEFRDADLEAKAAAGSVQPK